MAITDTRSRPPRSAVDQEAEVDRLPDPQRELPSIRIYGHSRIFYWWPVWAYGLFAAVVTYLRGGTVALREVQNAPLDQSSALGLGFVAVLFLTIFVTNVHLKGVYSLLVVAIVAFFTVLLAWLGWWDDIAEFIPQLSVHMNLGFYLVFTTLLLLLWLTMFAFVDRLHYWLVRPGQMTEEHLIGNRTRSYDTNNILFEKEAEDVFRHKLIGLGAGDLTLITAGARTETLRIENVLFVDRKVNAIQRLVATQPDDILHSSE